MIRLHPSRLATATMLALTAACGMGAAEAHTPLAEPAAPADALGSGVAQLLSATPLGGAGDDEVVAVGIAPDWSILVAGNCVDLPLAGVPDTLIGPAGTRVDPPPADPKTKGRPQPSSHGYILRLTSDGRKALALTRFGYGAATIQQMRSDDQGEVYIAGTNLIGAALSPGATPGRFVAKLAPDLRSCAWVLPIEGLSDFAIDGNGDVVALANKSLTRYAAGSGKPLWTATWATHGDNRPGAMTLASGSGITAVVGYGMTKTGHEPYKDPYAYAFDRAGKQVWAAWNPDPTKECDAKFGGNGLMADTTGHAAAATSDGKIMLMLYADGGNTVCMRDPADPGQPLDPAVLAGVHQAGAGYGFKGASKTSVIVRFDAVSGRIEKSTWMSAWLNPQHANGLSIDGASGDARCTAVVGNSANGCPLKDPWYPFIEGTYRGGGFLALFDRGFALQQCGYFAHAHLAAIAMRGDCVVVGGSVRPEAGPDGEKDPIKLHHAVQSTLGGDQDGYVVVLRREH